MEPGSGKCCEWIAEKWLMMGGVGIGVGDADFGEVLFVSASEYARWRFGDVCDDSFLG